MTSEPTGGPPTDPSPPATATTATTATTAGASLPAGRVGLAIAALALGGFTIGTTEFVTMGLLPEVARGIGESIPATGHVITAYALGVVVGAPLIVSLAARLPRRELAVGLILALGLGNALTAVAVDYPTMLAARFVAGLPHGAYFGVASLLAASLVPTHRRGRAVSQVMLGLSVGTVVGVPLSTWLGQLLGWRSAYWMVLVLAALTAALVLVALPHAPGNPGASVRGELTALRSPAVLFAVAAGMVGFGGVFAMYSYIAPIVTEVTGLPRSVIPIFLLVFGAGAVVGTGLAGRLADWDLPRSVMGGFVALAVTLTVFTLAAGIAVVAVGLVFAVGVLGSVLAVTLQVRLMVAAGDAQMLGAALNHSALNLANGLGAWLGAVVIAAGWGYRAPSLVGAGLAVAGLMIFVAGLRRQRRRS